MFVEHSFSEEIGSISLNPIWNTRNVVCHAEQELSSRVYTAQGFWSPPPIDNLGTHDTRTRIGLWNPILEHSTRKMAATTAAFSLSACKTVTRKPAPVVTTAAMTLPARMEPLSTVATTPATTAPPPVSATPKVFALGSSFWPIVKFEAAFNYNWGRIKWWWHGYFDLARF